MVVVATFLLGEFGLVESELGLLGLLGLLGVGGGGISKFQFVGLAIAKNGREFIQNLAQALLQEPLETLLLHFDQVG